MSGPIQPFYRLGCSFFSFPQFPPSGSMVAPACGCQSKAKLAGYRQARSYAESMLKVFDLQTFQCIALVLSILCLAHLMVLSFSPSTDSFDTLSALSSFLASIGLIWISALHHKSSVKPSDLSVLYLLATTLCCFSQVTFPVPTASQIQQSPHRWISIMELLVRIIMLLLEAQGKSSIIKPAYSHLSPEDTAGILSKVFFWWVNGILAQGNDTILQLSNIPHLDKKIRPSISRSNILRSWDQRGE